MEKLQWRFRALQAPEADAEIAPGMNEGVRDESVDLFNGELINGVLSLTFSDSYECYYIKAYDSYNITNVTLNGQEVTKVENVYKVNALSTVEISFNRKLEKVTISISINGIDYKDYTFNNN